MRALGPHNKYVRFNDVKTNFNGVSTIYMRMPMRRHSVMG